MRGAILSLFAVCLSAALLDLLAPGDGNRGLRRGLHLLTALAVLLLLLQPFLVFLRDAPESAAALTQNEAERDEFEAIFSETVHVTAAARLRQGLYDLLRTDYGIAKEDARVVLSFDGTGALSRVQIFLSGRALLRDPDALERDIGTRFDCQVEVR